MNKHPNLVENHERPKRWQRLRRYFVAGVVTLIPVWLTGAILVALFNFADGLLGKYINSYLLKTHGFAVPGLGLLLTFLLLLLVGFATSNFIGRKMFPFVERAFSKLPIIRQVYPSIRQIVDFFFSKERKIAFRKVVLAEYPSPELWSIGFVTNEKPGHMIRKLGKEVYCVLISTPPSPFSGPLIFLPKEKVIFLDLTIEQGVKLVVSGGVLTPDE